MWDFNSQKGFTLVEILIAIFLLSFISFGIISVTQDSRQTKDRTIEKDQNNLQVETALSRFEWDFSQIYSPLYFSNRQQTNQIIQSAISGQPGAESELANEALMLQESLRLPYEQNENFAFPNTQGLPVPRFFSPDKSTFEFFTTSNRRKVQNQKQSHYMWVRYSLADATSDPYDDEPLKKGYPRTNKNFVRYIQADNPWSPQRINPSELRPQILLENVEEVVFEYWDLDRRKFQDNLRSIALGEHRVRGVKLRLVWYDSFGQKRNLEKTFRPLWPEQLIEDPQFGNVDPSKPDPTKPDPSTTDPNPDGVD